MAWSLQRLRLSCAYVRVVASERLWLGSCTACQILFLFTTSVMLVFKFLAVLHHNNKVTSHDSCCQLIFYIYVLYVDSVIPLQSEPVLENNPSKSPNAKDQVILLPFRVYFLLIYALKCCSWICCYCDRFFLVQRMCLQAVHVALAPWNRQKARQRRLALSEKLENSLFSTSKMCMHRSHNHSILEVRVHSLPFF